MSSTVCTSQGRGGKSSYSAQLNDETPLKGLLRIFQVLLTKHSDVTHSDERVVASKSTSEFNSYSNFLLQTPNTLCLERRFGSMDSALGIWALLFFHLLLPPITLSLFTLFTMPVLLLFERHKDWRMMALLLPFPSKAMQRQACQFLDTHYVHLTYSTRRASRATRPEPLHTRRSTNIPAQRVTDPRRVVGLTLTMPLPYILSHVYVCSNKSHGSSRNSFLLLTLTPFHPLLIRFLFPGSLYPLLSSLSRGQLPLHRTSVVLCQNFHSLSKVTSFPLRVDTMADQSSSQGSNHGAGEVTGLGMRVHLPIVVTVSDDCDRLVPYSFQMPRGELGSSSEPPRALERPRDAYASLLTRALVLGLNSTSRVKFTIGTMFSGSDAPVLALRELRDAAIAQGYPALLDFNHEFSVEIEKYKAAFIGRNSKPRGHIYRNAIDLADPDKTTAMTAEGSMAPVPEAPDLLVAGSSCVDFSKQNNRRNPLWAGSILNQTWQEFKASDKVDPRPPSARHEVLEFFQRQRAALRLGGQGESTQTFVALIQYIYHKRPKVVLLENVAGAPWKQFSNFWMPFVGYVAEFVKVDSKDFLVPQTRNRGYLVAVDQWHYGEKSQSIAEIWARLMRGSNWFENCHPPIHKFLLAPDDPRILEARFVDERRVAENLTRDPEARMCSYDHAKVRRERDLGSTHPYTRLDARGNVTPRDTAWRAFVQAQGNRVLDLLDIVFLQAHKEGMDLEHKTKTLDLGQGVERMNSKLGIAGCILPDANLFLTDQGRPVLGAEALMLQAIPLDRVRISVETQRELHDLAGNAMTATVVGAAMLAVFIAERQVMGQESALKGSDDEDEADIIRRLPVLGRRQEHNGGRSIYSARMETSLHFTTTKREWIKVGDLLRIYTLGRRYCPCGGFRKHHPAKGLKKCVICAEIRCNECAGNPAHDFMEFHLEHDVCSMDETTAALYKLLPGRFRLARDDIHSTDHFDTQRILRDLVGDADSSLNADVLHMLLTHVCAFLDSVFYLTSINIGQVITANYMSRHSRMDLVIEEDCIKWQLFLHAGSGAAEEIQGKMEWDPKVPIARAVLDNPELSFLPDTEDWNIFWSRGNDMITLTFSPTDQGLACQVEAYNHRPIAECRQDPRVSDLVETLRGQFKRSTCCGTPMGILYTRVDDSRRQRPLYAFKDVGRATSPEQDHWVLARSARKEQLGGRGTFDCPIPVRWFRPFFSPSRRGFRIAQFPPSVLQPISFAFEEMHVGHGLERFFPDPEQGLFPLMQLRLPIPDMYFPVPLLPRLWNTNGQVFKHLAHRRDDSGMWLRVPEDLHRDALRVVEFATRMIGPHFFPREIRQGLLVECDQATLEQLEAGFRKPKLFRVWESARFVEVFEDPAVLPRYVEALDKRPLPLELDVQLVEAGATRLAGELLYSVRPDFESLVDPELLMKFLVNPTALAHEAWQHLPTHGAEKAKAPRRDKTQRMGFRVEFGFVDPSLKNLAPFRHHLLAGSPSGRSDFAEEQHILPPSFARNNMRLRPDQEKAVLWMVRQESPATCFIESESAEYLISDTIRMRAHAEVTNRARGGVLAHDVGYGKTVVTLGLIDYQRMKNPHGSVEERLSWTQHGHQHLKASLIICPPQIVRQWELEAKKFLGSGWKILTIQSATKVLKANLEKADIVIVSSSVIEDLKSLRKLAALVGERESNVRDLPERVFGEWYRDCLDLLRLHRQTWEEDGYVEAADEIRELQQLRDKELQQAQKKRVPDSSRKAQKTTMESFPLQNTTGSGPKKEEEDDSSERHRKLPWNVSTEEVRCAYETGKFLQLYTFERVVMDEFSYENKFVFAFVKNAVAGSKWILSGTPPVANLAQVCAMGELINIHIARYEPSVPSWFPAITKGPRPDYLTKSESLRSYGVPKTAQFALERHQHACRFLEEKVRQQETDTSHIQTTEQAIVCYMDPISAVVYYQFHRRLRDSNWDTEEVPDEVKPIMASLLAGADLSSSQRHNRARENLRTTWRNTIQALLAQASLNLAPFAESLQNMGLDISDGGNAVDLITQSVWSVYEREITRYKKMLKSQFDMTMYLLTMALRDAENPEIRLTPTQNAKRETYIDHWNDMLQEIKTARMPAEKLGDNQIRAVLFDVVAPKTGPRAEAGEGERDFWDSEQWSPWYGGRGIHTPLDWWDLTQEDLATMPRAELGYLKAVLTQFDECYNNKDPSPVQGKDGSEEEDLAAAVKNLLKTGIVKQHRNANNDEVADHVGLKNKARITAYWADKTRAKDFMFGSRLYPSRPKSGREIIERGVQQDQVINHFQMSVQNVGEGIRKFVQSYRNLRVVMRIIELLSRGTPDARRIDCDECKGEITAEVPLDRVHLFMACGHILCHACACAYRLCEAVSVTAASAAGAAKKCAAPSCGSMDGDSLVRTDEIITESMDMDEMISLRGPSAKVRKIMETIQRDVVKQGENALIFVGFESLKLQLFEALQGAGLDVYMTTGSPLDGGVIERFKKQDEDKTTATTKILIQSILTSESAGTNLPEVNHVMFASPLHTDTESYYAYHRQAIGRAKRAGQTRTVNIYHFVTAHTMEVEVLEHRLGYPLYVASNSDRVPIDVQRRDEHERRLLFGNTSGRARHGDRIHAGQPCGKPAVPGPDTTARRPLLSAGGNEGGNLPKKRIVSHIDRQEVRRLLHSQEYHEFLDELDHEQKRNETKRNETKRKTGNMPRLRGTSPLCIFIACTSALFTSVSFLILPYDGSTRGSFSRRPSPCDTENGLLGGWAWAGIPLSFCLSAYPQPSIALRITGWATLDRTCRIGKQESGLNLGELKGIGHRILDLFDCGVSHTVYWMYY
ncbi:hypothetical protein ACRALDRAFT_207366 [Sodiomyces alcalophilus JCM 7366]|uniref:uncharacterized protein n=1 Tax=Sodiomyces alcalophilus JCM 7366 TaxID=591952 RepID=UPI0039B6BDF1